MRRILAVLLLCSLCGTGVSVRAASSIEEEPPVLSGDYDVLTLTWRPTYCAMSENASRPECLPGATSTQLMLGGLSLFWDINGDQKHDSHDRYCMAEPAARADIMARDKAAAGRWTDLPDAPLSPGTRQALLVAMPQVLSGFERHEWWKRGTCSGLSADAYFALALRMTRDVLDNAFGEAILDNAGEVVNRKVLRRAFRLRYGKARMPALMLNCLTGPDGQQMLLEARIRVTRELADRGIVGSSLYTLKAGQKGNCGKKFLIPAP